VVTLLLLFISSASAAQPIFYRLAVVPPALPVPPASTKQKHNYDDKQNHFYTHFEALLMFDL
jgi:hypothetical protein